MAEDYFFDDDYDDGPPAPLFWRILGKVFKYTGIGIIVLINALLLWRVFFSTNEPSAIKTIAVNDSLAAAYEQHGGEGFALYQAEQDNIATDEDWHKQFPDDDPKKLTNQFAQFFLTDVVFFPKAGQTQVVLRYNKSILEHIAADFELDGAPGKKDDVFDITLVVYYTPAADSAQKSMRIKATLAESATTSLYSFRQLVFEGMPEFESITGMNVEIYYKGDVNYAEKPYSVIELYEKNLGTREYELDKKDIAALESSN